MAKKKVRKQANPESFDFEAALGKLQSIVSELEQGELGLNDSMERYEEGVKHLKRCFDLLTAAEQRIALLTGVDAEGKPVTQDFDDEHHDLHSKATARSRRRTAKRANPASNALVDEQSGLF